MRVTVEQIGGTENVLVPDGSTVRDVVRLSTDREPENYSVTVDDRAAELSDSVHDGSLVSIVPTKTKGA